MQMKILFFQNFTGGIIRELDILYASQLLNNKATLIEFLGLFNEKTDYVFNQGYEIRSRSEIRQEGKKKKELLESFHYIELEATSNAKNYLTIAEAERARQDIDYACVTNQTKKVPSKKENIIPDYAREAKKEDWQLVLITAGLYTSENVPKKRSKKVYAEIEQACALTPPSEVVEKTENPRKKHKV